MDTHSSKINLLMHQADEGSAEHSSPHLNKITRKASKREVKEAYLFFIGFVLFAFIITTICIAAFYIQKLHHHVDHLEDRVRILEETVSSNPCQTRKEEPRQFGDGVTKDVEVRSKRHTAGEEEDAHTRSEHHGIASHNIALVYGDPKTIGRISDASDPNSLLHFSYLQTSKRRSKCKSGFVLKKNDLHDYWCAPTTPGLKDKMKLTKDNHFYHYFKKAAWMINDAESSKRYNLTHAGEISVGQEGIYIVHASVHFSDVSTVDFPHYGVYKTDEFGNNRTLISKCVVSVQEDVDGVYPCQAWQLTHLKAKDRISLSIGGYVWFRIEKETFHLALIKLNDAPL